MEMVASVISPEMSFVTHVARMKLTVIHFPVIIYNIQENLSLTYNSVLMWVRYSLILLDDNSTFMKVTSPVEQLVVIFYYLQILRLRF